MNQYWYSKLSTANTCLRKFQHQFIKPDGSHYSYAEQKREPGPLSADMEFGTAIHKGIESFFLGEDGVATFLNHMTFLGGLEMRYTRYKHQELTDMGETLLKRFDRLHKAHFTDQVNKGRISSTPLEGEPDWLGLYKNIPTALDFKTSKDAYLKERLDVDEQLIFYSHLAKSVMNYEVKQIAYMVFIKSEIRIQVLTAPMTPQILETRLAEVERTINTLNSLDFFPKNSRSCVIGKFKCGFFDYCHKP